MTPFSMTFFLVIMRLPPDEIAERPKSSTREDILMLPVLYIFKRAGATIFTVRRPVFAAILCAALALAVMTWLAAMHPNQAQAAAPSRARPPIRIVYGFDREFPPFTFEEAGGAPVGFEVDLIQAVFQDMPVELIMRPLNWEMVPIELSAGTINITSGMVRTMQREQLYQFSTLPTFPLQIRLFTKVYNRFPSAALLRGQTVSVQEGSYQQRVLEQFGGINIKPQKDRVAGLRALYNDDVVAYCGLVQNTYYYINKLNYGAITTVGTPLGITEMRFAVNRDRGDILALANEGLQRVIDSGEYDRIYRKWFVRDLSDTERQAMINAAKQGAIPAYSPYSKESAGACVLTVTGNLYSACNIENADPELNISAVRAATAKAICNGDFEIRAAVMVRGDGSVVRPSDNDLQQLFEFGRGILIMLEPSPSSYSTHMLPELLKKPIIKESVPVINE